MEGYKEVLEGIVQMQWGKGLKKKKSVTIVQNIHINR